MMNAEPAPVARLGDDCAPPADLVGGFVCGSLSAPRQVVQAEALFRAYHELELPPGLDADTEAYETLFRYPHAEYTAHIRQHGSPKGYDGPAACCRLVWDIDRPNLDTALNDARQLVCFLLDRYGTHAESTLAIYFSGSKGFHVSLLNHPGFMAFAKPPAIAKRLALVLACSAGVTVDACIYDRQRLFRLPNSKHPRTGLFKRFIELDDLQRLDAARIRAAAQHPAGYAVPSAPDECVQLVEDWLEAEASLGTAPAPAAAPTAQRVPPSHAPVVPKFVLDFIGFGDVQDPGRAITLFRCSAALAEAGTPAPVVYGLLEEVAMKIGLEAWEVQKQIDAGIAHGTRKGA